MDVDLERERELQLRSYRFCWIGFSLYALNLSATTLVAIAGILLRFAGQNPHVGYWLGIDPFDFDYGFETIRTWERLLACLALAAAWPADLGWRRRTMLLLALALGDVVLWTVWYAVPLGLATEPSRHLIFCSYLMMTLGWSRFLLIAGLAADFARHAGMPRAEEFGKAARKAATTGAAVWFLYFVVRINWSRPWPLAERRMTLEAIQLMLAGQMINVLCLVQSSLLTLLASRAASRSLRAMAQEDRAFDPWSSAAGFDPTPRLSPREGDRCEHGPPRSGPAPPRRDVTAR
jgi:hypothetical protein